MSLKHTKNSLSILSGRFLARCKVRSLVAFRAVDGPWRIYAIGKVVSHVLLMTIDNIVARWIFTGNKPCKKRSLLDIEITVRARHPEVCVPNQEIM